MATAPTIYRPRVKTQVQPRAKKKPLPFSAKQAFAVQTTVTPPGGVLFAQSYVLNLDTPGAYASIPAIPAYQIGTGDFSVEVWCSGPVGGPLASFIGASGALMTISIDATGDLSVVEGSTVIAHVGQPTSVTDSNWHLVSVTRASGTITIYLDGVEVAVGAEATPFPITGVTAFLMGTASSVNGAPTYLGTFADVRLWNVARSQVQVQQAMCYRLPSNTTAIGYWTFAGQSLTDYSINHNNGGTLSTGANYIFVPINYYPHIGCVQLSGATPSVSIAGNAAYNVGTNDFTIEAWVQAFRSGTILARTAAAGAGTAGFALSVTDGGMLSFMTSEGTAKTTVTQTAVMDALLTVWHHVSVTRQAGAITIYVDGIPIATGTEGTPTSINVAVTTPLVLGSTVVHGPAPYAGHVGVTANPPLPVGTEPFTLQLAEIRVWNLAVSQAALYRGMLIESHGDEPGLIGYWNCSTGSIIDRSNTRNLAVSPYTATIGAPTQPIALAQYVLTLPGNGYMIAPYVKGMDFGTSDFTLETRFSATAAGTIMSRPFDVGAPSCGMQMRIDAATLTLILSSGQATTTFTGNVALLDGNFHHIAWLRTAGVISLFVDDVMVACTQTLSTQAITTPTNFVVGALFDASTATYGDYLTGIVDFVILWGSARSLSELQMLSYIAPGGSVQEAAGAWSFDEQAPIDESRSNANGALGGGATINANYTLAATTPLSTTHLPGGTSAIDCSARTDLSFGGVQRYTMGAWIKPMAANATGTIISRFDSAGASEYRLRLVNGVPVAERSASNGVVTGVTQLKPEWWYFVSMTYDGTNLSVQVNGITEQTAAVGAITAATATHVLIGASSNGSATTDNLVGCIQSVQVWTTAMTSAQLQSTLDANLTGIEPGLQAYWNFVYASSQDWTTHGPAATLTGNARYQSTTRWRQEVRNALAFDGTGSYINCGGGRSLNVKGSMTLEAWVRLDVFTSAWQTIVAKGSVYQIRRYNDTNQITFSTANLSVPELASTANFNLLDGNWHHVAAVYDGAMKSLYLDGTLNATVAATGDISKGNGVLYFADNDGEVLVVDQETGNEIWTARVFKPIQTSPVTDKNVMCVSSPSGDIFAFDYSTRQRLWDTQIPQGYQVPMTINRDVIYFSGAGTAISAVDLISGNVLWNMRGIANPVAPTIVDTTAFYGAQNTVFSRDLVSGSINWAYNFQDSVLGAPMMLGKNLFVNCADNSLYALILGTVTQAGGSFSASANLIGSPIIENGVIYVATTDGTVTALTYNVASQSFATVWSAKIAAGLTQAIAVDYPFVSAIGNDNNLYTYNAGTGNLTWQWTSGTGTPQALSGLTLVNGAAYISAANGIYSALDLENKTVLWTKDLQTVATAPGAVTYAPFCIGASVNEQGAIAPGTFHGLISEVRLWQEARSAGDIATTFRRKIVGDEPTLAGYWPCSSLQAQEPDFSSHMNPGVYTGSVVSSLVDLQLLDPLPRLLAQAQMMQNWSQADVAANNQSGQVVFRTEISLIDSTGSPLVGSAIRVFTDAPTSILIGGVAYDTDNQKAAQVMTDQRGMISVVTPCVELSSSTLQIWAAFMQPDERIIIHPDENLSNTLGSVHGVDLINPSQSTNPLINGKPALLTGVTQEQADGLASAINNAIQNVKKPVTGASRYSARPRAMIVGGTPVHGDVVSQGITLANGVPYAQYVGPGSIPNWQFNFQSYAFNPINNDELAVMRAQRATKQTLTAQDEGFWDLWNDFVNGVKEAATVVFEAIGNAVKIIVHWVDTTIQTLEHIFETVAQVGQAIFGLFKQILSDIVDAAKKIYEFFAFLFNWDDILHTKNALIGYFRQSMGQIGPQIDLFIAHADTFFTTIENDLDSAFETIIGRIGKQSLGQVKDSAPSMNPMLPGLPSGNYSSAKLMATTDSQAVFGAEGNWLVSTTFENAGGITGGGLLSWSNDAVGYIGQAFDEIAQIAGTSKALAAFKSSYQYFAQVGSNPEAFLQLIVQGLLEAVKGLADLAIEIAKIAFVMLLKAVKMFINIMLDALAEPIDIPVVSWLYEKVSGASLSILDLIALIAAIPTTIIYKAFTGEAPFREPRNGIAKTANGKAAVGSSDMPGWQKGLKTTQAILQLLSIPIAMILDVQEVVPVETRAANGPGVFTHTQVPWGGRIAQLFGAASLKTAASPKLGPAIVRWLNFGMKAMYTAFGAPWIYNSNPTDFEKYTWLFYLIELTVVEFFFALYTQITGLAWMLNEFAWAIPTAVGLFRMFAVIVATAVSDKLPAASTVVSAFFSPLPSLCKFLRYKKIVAATEGISIAILLLVDLLAGVVPPIITLGATWG